VTPSLKINSAQVTNEFVTLIIDPSSHIQGDTVYNVRASNLTSANGQDLDRGKNSSQIKRTLYLAIVWHQHQPMYLDPLKDELLGPWVRKHAKKSYYDMASAVEPFKDVHFTINLTPVLLIQLQRYIDRLGPFYNAVTNRIDAAAFLKKWEGKTDPWIDLLLKPTSKPEALSKYQKELFYNGPWSTVSTSPQVMNFFTEYEDLRDKNRAQYTHEDLLKLKFYFEIAWFDPEFLDGPVKMPDGSVVDLSDIMEKRADGKYYRRVDVTEDICNRLVAENYKIMKNVVAIHQKLIYNPHTKDGQIEVITTPFYHPILPLLYDTNLAKKTHSVDDIVLPPEPFQYPDDALIHVAKAKALYQRMFGFAPQGMWPAEGSVSQEVIGQFAQYGVRWIATGEENLRRSQPYKQAIYYPYSVQSQTKKGTSYDNEVMIVFRHDDLSDTIGFRLQGLSGEDAANTLLSGILANAPRFGEKDRLLTIILDGENAWEHFTKDYDAKDFFRRFYGKLQASYTIGEVISVTPTEYIDGNPRRNVPAHPINEMTKLTNLNAGSWIDGTYRIWIGEDEETCGWNYLLQTRRDLERSGIPRPNPFAAEPSPSHPAYNAYMAWESMYAAQGSDWFWWFGDDMTSAGNDDSGFDIIFRALLTAVYDFANKAGANLKIPNFRPCVQPTPKPVPNTPCTQCPTINGKFDPDPSEWTNDGGSVQDVDSANPDALDPDDHINTLFITFNLQKLFLGISTNIDIKSKLNSNYQMAVYFSHRNVIDKNTGKTQDDKPVNKTTPEGVDLTTMKPGGAARRLLLDFSGPSIKATIQRADGNGGWTNQSGSNVEVGGPTDTNRLIELGIPWQELNLKIQAKEQDPLEIIVVASQTGKMIDRAPNFNTFTVFEDLSDAVYVIFEVDVSGKEEPLDRYASCCKEQPKPRGQANAYIVGNHRLLGMTGTDAQGNPIWVPNKIQMTQDTKEPHIWRFGLLLPNGHKVSYKYTIGTNSDEGRWSRTEEFPVTFRGFTVEDPSGKRCIRIRDIFANKPTGGRDGEIGSKSKFETVCTPP
jgi:alpha-amylase/alpha-mannosidase (GH57 family)